MIQVKVQRLVTAMMNPIFRAQEAVLERQPAQLQVELLRLRAQVRATVMPSMLRRAPVVSPHRLAGHTDRVCAPLYVIMMKSS